MSLYKRKGRKYGFPLIATLIIIVAIAINGVWWSKNDATKTSTYDVIVVGAGPGGIAASIQAARTGAHVALLEETDWIGGQMTAAGVGTMDEGSTLERNSGLYKEFITLVSDFYKSHHKSFGTCYYSTDTVCVDPKVGQTILKQLLDKEKPNLDVLTNTKVTDVIKDGSTVKGVVANGKQLSSKVVIDAGEYGDIIAKSGAKFRLGNGTSDHPNPSSCVQNITNTAVIKYYPQGVPEALQFKKPPPGYTANTQAHFAAFLKKNGYGLTIRPTGHYAARKSPMSFEAYAAFRGYPDLSNPQDYNAFEQNGHVITRTGLNLGNDFPSNGSLDSTYISDDRTRLQTECQAKLLTLQLIYYIQHDLGQTNWSIANDEGYDTPYNQQHDCPKLKGYEAFEHNMAQEPYVREGRRLIGIQTLTGNDLQYAWKDRSQLQLYPDSITVGYYPMDLHGCQDPKDLESDLDSPADVRPAFAASSFEVPIGVLIPKSIDGLLAAERNISVSRLANGATREQPIAMNIGQAAGALAAEAARQNIPPRDVKAADVQSVLKAANVTMTISRKNTSSSTPAH